MMNKSLQKHYNFELRLATESEIQDLADFLVNKNWQDQDQKLNSISSIVKSIIASDFMNNDKSTILALIGGKALVEDFKKYDIRIFSYTYLQELKRGTIISLPFRILQNKQGFTLLEEEDAVFDLRTLKNQKPLPKPKVGKMPRPKLESIQKSLEIKKYFEKQPELGIDGICKEFGFSKSTYYRTLKWLRI